MAKNFLSTLFGKKPQEKEGIPPEDAEALPDIEPENDSASALLRADTPQQPAVEKKEINPKTIEEGTPDTDNEKLEVTGESGNEPPAIDGEDKSPVDRQAFTDIQEQPEPAPKKKKGIFARLKEGLSKTSSQLTEGVSSIFTKKKLDDEMLEDLENLLISADLGVSAAARITSTLAKSKFDREVSEDEVKTALADDISQTLSPFEKPLKINSAHRPHIVLMIGVNGAGKTTTIGKLASKFKAEGKSVMLAAGDTFRAAAIEQLTIWGERTDTPVISRQVGADAAGLAFDAIQEAISQNIDVLMIDTAGRLQNRTELMDELAKIVRVIGKIDPEAPHDVILVLDATVGQNALSQVDVFAKTAGVTGLIMTKLDGTARGGVLVALAEKFALPIHFIGVGENIEDLQSFEARPFATALTGLDQ